MPDYSTQVLELVIETLQKVMTESHAALRQAAQAIANAVNSAQLLFLYADSRVVVVKSSTLTEWNIVR